MRRVPGSLYLLVAVFAFRAVPVQAAPQRATPTPAATLDRTVLPIPEPTYPPVTELDARKVTPPPVFDVKAPAGAPNVLIILIDDMGFGMPSAFGGPIHMPTVDRLASEGLRYNQFHTTAVCSPTRTALLSGRNHHMNNMGGITETATAFPGNTGQRPNNVAPLAEMLRLNGYSTGFFGKNHETAPWEVSPSGPTDRWPTRSGFDEFYGYDGVNQYPLEHSELKAIGKDGKPVYIGKPVSLAAGGQADPVIIRSRAATAEPLIPSRRPVDLGRVFPQTSFRSYSPSFDEIFEDLWDFFDRPAEIKSEQFRTFTMEIRLTQDQANRGGRVQIRMPLQHPCATCNSTGEVGPFQCWNCGGTGSALNEP